MPQTLQNPCVSLKEKLLPFTIGQLKFEKRRIIANLLVRESQRKNSLILLYYYACKKSKLFYIFSKMFNEPKNHLSDYDDLFSRAFQGFLGSLEKGNYVPEKASLETYLSVILRRRIIGYFRRNDNKSAFKFEELKEEKLKKIKKTKNGWKDQNQLEFDGQLDEWITKELKDSNSNLGKRRQGLLLAIEEGTILSKIYEKLDYSSYDALNVDKPRAKEKVAKIIWEKIERNIVFEEYRIYRFFSYDYVKTHIEIRFTTKKKLKNV